MNGRLERFDQQPFAVVWNGLPGPRAGWYLVYTPPFVAPDLRFWVPRFDGVFRFPASRWHWLGEAFPDLGVVCGLWEEVVAWSLDEHLAEELRTSTAGEGKEN